MTGDDEALPFAERLLALLDATRYSATYKLATLLALIDVAAERTGADGSVPDILPGKAVARRVIELYWPQTVPYGAAPGGEPKVLAQAPQNDIPAKLAAWRANHRLHPRASLQDARAADPGGWERLEAELVAVVIGMPLAKLQRFGEGRSVIERRFIYEFAWREEIGVAAVTRPGFDDSLHLQPGIGGMLVRLAPLIRPLVQAKWTAMVAARNPDLTDAGRVGDFLFGAERISLDRVRGPLAELQDHGCFYCGDRLKTRWDVDHFLPWSRHPDNTLDNLVAAHMGCNNAKSASLAALGHLERWIDRLGDAETSARLQAVQAETAWPRRADRVLATARATYLWLPEGTMLWRHQSVYEPVDPARARAVLDRSNQPGPDANAALAGPIRTGSWQARMGRAAGRGR